MSWIANSFIEATYEIVASKFLEIAEAAGPVLREKRQKLVIIQERSIWFCRELFKNSSKEGNCQTTNQMRSIAPLGWVYHQPSLPFWTLPLSSGSQAGERIPFVHAGSSPKYTKHLFQKFSLAKCRSWPLKMLPSSWKRYIFDLQFMLFLSNSA